jgi:hypothetical protein
LKLRVSAVFSLSIFIFLSAFQPFGIEHIPHHKYWILAGYGLMTFLGMLFCFFVLPLLLPAFFNPENWQVKNHLLFCLLNLLVITLLNWGFDSICESTPGKRESLLYFILVTISVGFMPLVILTLIIERRLLRQNSIMAQSIFAQLEEPRTGPGNDQHIELVSDNVKESMRLSRDQLVCVAAEGNYSKVYYRDQEAVSERLIRSPLKNIEASLKRHGGFVRCHRSYIINLYHITQASGNARSLKLQLDRLNFEVPVSRGFSQTILGHLASL